MKTPNWIFSILAAVLLAGTGCSQGEKAPAPTIINGVPVDLLKFQRAFAGGSPELQNSVSRVHLAIRYGQYREAVTRVEKVANTSGLTEPQKNVADEVLKQLKQVASRSPSRAPY